MMLTVNSIWQNWLVHGNLLFLGSFYNIATYLLHTIGYLQFIIIRDLCIMLIMTTEMVYFDQENRYNILQQISDKYV